MEKTWKPTVAGILNIIAGALRLIYFFFMIVAVVAVGSSPFMWDSVPGMYPMTVGTVQTILVLIAVYSFVTGVLPLVGGIFALRRKKWGLALAGAIVAIIGLSVLGVASTVITALCREEFE